MNPEPNIEKCERGSAIGIGMWFERAERLLDFEIAGEVGSRARRSGNLVADVDEQSGSTRVATTQGGTVVQEDSRRRRGRGRGWGERPTTVEEGGNGEGLSQSSMRVLPAACERNCPWKLLFCFPKTQFSSF